MEQAFDGLRAVHFQESDPGTRWHKDDRIVIDLDSLLDSERILTPNVIRLPTGGYRMYYEARSEGVPTVVLSATSVDGLRWDLEPGIRFGDNEWSYGSPRCLYIEEPALPDYRFRLYFHRYTYGPLRSGLDSPNHIISAVSVFTAASVDGLTWTKEFDPLVELGGRWNSHMVSEPCVIELPDGRSRMFYEAKDANGRARILSATSY